MNCALRGDGLLIEMGSEVLLQSIMCYLILLFIVHVLLCQINVCCSYSSLFLTSIKMAGKSLLYSEFGNYSSN